MKVTTLGTPRGGLLCATLFATTMAASVANAVPVVNDQFADGGRTNGADALDAAWFFNTGGAGITVDANQVQAPIAGNSLFVDSGAAGRFMVASFTPVTLGAGTFSSTMRLTFDFRVMDANIASNGAPGLTLTNSNFLFGLYNTNGTNPTADNTTASTNDFGYRSQIPVGVGGTATSHVTIAQETGTNADILAGTDGNGTLNAATNTGSATRIGDANTYRALLEVRNLGATVEIFTSISNAAGTLLTSATRVDTGTIRNTGGANTETGTNQRYTTFGMVVIGGGAVDQNFRVDNVLVDVVPEPGTWAAFAAVPALLFVARRRLTAGRRAA